MIPDLVSKIDPNDWNMRGELAVLDITTSGRIPQWLRVELEDWMAGV